MVEQDRATHQQRADDNDVSERSWPSLSWRRAAKAIEAAVHIVLPQNWCVYQNSAVECRSCRKKGQKRAGAGLFALLLMPLCTVRVVQPPLLR